MARHVNLLDLTSVYRLIYSFLDIGRISILETTSYPGGKYAHPHRC